MEVNVLNKQNVAMSLLNELINALPGLDQTDDPVAFAKNMKNIRALEKATNSFLKNK